MLVEIENGTLFIETIIIPSRTMNPLFNLVDVRNGRYFFFIIRWNKMNSFNIDSIVDSDFMSFSMKW
jgi:hypothetical protein